MDEATKAILVINGLRWSLKYKKINFIIHKNISTFIDFSIFSKLNPLHKDFLNIYDIFGLTNSSYEEIQTRNDLVHVIERKKTDLIPTVKLIYQELRTSKELTIKTLINLREQKTIIKIANSELIKLINQCIDLESQGIKSVNFLDAFISFDNLILEILSDDLYLQEYRKLWVVSRAFNRNPGLFFETVVDLIPTTNLSKESKELELLLSQDSALWSKEETTIRFQKLVSAETLIKQKFIDTQGILTEIITLLEDLKLDQSEKLVNSIFTCLNKKDLNSIKNLLHDISIEVVRNINELLAKYQIKYNSFISILGFLNDENTEDFNNFQGYYTLLDLLDSIGINFYLNAEGNLIIKPNIDILEEYLKGYNIS